MWWEIIKTCWIVTAPQDVANFMEDIRSEYRVDFGREATSKEIVAKAPNFLRWAYGDDNIFHEPSFFGSHPEYGEADGWAVIAIPKGVEITESFTHGYYGRRDGWDQAFQAKCLEWDGETWIEIDLASYPNLYEEKPAV